jgi:hypothetical protein
MRTSFYVTRNFFDTLCYHENEEFGDVKILAFFIGDLFLNKRGPFKNPKKYLK